MIKNANGHVTLLADGTANINGVTIDKDGNIVAPGSLILNGKEIDGHTHGGVASGGSNTGPNN